MKSIEEKVIKIIDKELDKIIENQNKPKADVKLKLNKDFFEDLDSAQSRIDEKRKSIQNTKR